jgi:hypothetical protein
MAMIEAQFLALSREDPDAYIMGRSPIEYKCDGNEGSITFDGYFYVEDHPPPYPEDEGLEFRPRRHAHWLPKKQLLSVTLRETEEKETPTDISGTYTITYKIFETRQYIVEVYKKVIHECTDQYGDLGEDWEDGTPMKVCFFPTNKQTLYFRILENFWSKVYDTEQSFSYTDKVLNAEQHLNE